MAKSCRLTFEAFFDGCSLGIFTVPVESDRFQEGCSPEGIFDWLCDETLFGDFIALETYEEEEIA